MTDVLFDCEKCKRNVKVTTIDIDIRTHYIRIRLLLECGHDFTFNVDYD